MEPKMSDDAPLLGSLMCQRFNQEVLPRFGTQTDLERASAAAEAEAVARGEPPMGIFRQSQVSKIVREDGPAWSRLDTYSQRLHRMGLDPWLLLPERPGASSIPEVTDEARPEWEQELLAMLQRVPDAARGAMLNALTELLTPDRSPAGVLPETLMLSLAAVRGEVLRADRAGRAAALAEQVRETLAAEGLSVAELLAALE